MTRDPLIAPDIILNGSDGPRRLRPQATRLLLLILYQEDQTPTCTTELRSFAGEFTLLSELGTEVVGVSTDDVESHRAFLERLGGLPFPLLTDRDGVLAKSLNAWDEDAARAKRAIFVIDAMGQVVHGVVPFNPANLNEYERVFHVLGLGEGPVLD